MKQIVVIGGGITGLAAAHRLVEFRRMRGLELEIILLEASARLGGMIHTEPREGFLLERGPDSFISEKPEALDLAKRLGIASQLIETNKEHRRSFVVLNGKLRPVPDGFLLLAPSRLWPLVTSDMFSWAGKARIAMDLLLPRGNTKGTVDESLAQFVRRRLGCEALERMAQPMLGGIYTADPELLSLRATMPRFLEMEREHGSVIRGLRKEGRSATLSNDRSPTVTEARDVERSTRGARYSLFLSFERGMQTLVDQLSSKLPQGLLKLNAKVESLWLDRASKRCTIKTELREPIRADAVCIALPAYAAAQLLRETDSALTAELRAIPYASTATINLAYKRSDIPHPLRGFGFVVPSIENRSLIACTFSSVKFAGRAPEGCVLLRVFVGGALQPEFLALDEHEILQKVFADLRELLGIEQPPHFAEATKWHRSMPQYHVGHLDRVQRIDDHLRKFPSLKIAGSAFTGVGIPDCIRSGERAAGEIVAFLTADPGQV